uniref:acyl-coenzyme A synthetase ACSM1, mitochondrial-like isoform X8 n=1 Tax=Halichoerus grypus TaxID=9711 RepID=UPI001658D94A|nr:acyl-coenzyme A synthetase ACSM1, mitochondrial-like isoform X8 [Halichoerus grypus]
MTKIRFWGQETGQINVKAKKKKKEKPYCHHVPFLSILCGKSFFMYVIEYRPQQIDYWNKTLKMLTTCCLGSPLLVGPVWRCQPMQRKKEGRPADTLPGASSSQGPKGVSCGTLRGMKIKPGSIGKGIPRLRRPGLLPPFILTSVTQIVRQHWHQDEAHQAHWPLHGLRRQPSKDSRSGVWGLLQLWR